MRRILHAIVVTLGLLSAAVLIMFILGSALPREHIATASTMIHAPQGRIWSLMEDLDAQPHWRTSLKSIEALPNDSDGHRCWAEVQRGMRIPLCEETVDAPTTRVVAIADPTLNYGGRWTYNLTALTPDTTQVTILEEGTVDSPLWRFVGHYLFHEDTFLKRYEADLQRAATR